MSVDELCGVETGNASFDLSAETNPMGFAICDLNDKANSMAEGLNVFFLLFAGAVVFLMQSGFAMLCAGSVRQKNVKNIMLKNLLDACGGALGFFFVGYGFAYGNAEGTVNTRFIGNADFLLLDFTTGGQYIGWFFQFAFAATAATIVAGTVAERCKMAAYLCYSVFLTGFVYPVVVHSIWAGDGFLSAFASDPANLFQDIGVIDFAGSGVVHMTGGATALVAAIVLGPRKGRFYDEDGNPLAEPVTFAPHSVALQILGTFILWFGWYGFNPGSALAINSGDLGSVVGLCAVTTTMSAAAGCVSAMFTDTIIDAMATGEVSYDLTMAMNGALGGLVGITSSTSVVTPWAALVIGVIAGWVYYLFSKLLIRLRIDDAVDAIPVHFANGAWGVIAAGIFSEESRQALAYGNTTHVGLIYGGSGNLLLAQIVAVAWILAWVAGTMTPFFLVLRFAGMFRVDPLEEEVGLDISHHRGAAYDLSGPGDDAVEELMELRASKHGKVQVPVEVSQAAYDAPVAAPEPALSEYSEAEEEVA